MKLFEFQLKLKSPFMTPWQGDILFGHLAWAYRDKYGEKKLTEWLKEFCDTPSFVLSDGFIKNSFPKPLIPPPNKKAFTKEEKIQQIKKGKQLKKLRLLHEEDFLSFIQGDPITFSKEVVGKYKSVIQTHNIVGRETGKSLSSDGLYELESTYLIDQDTISFFARVKDEHALELLKELLELVSVLGYGKKKSLGYGQFKVISYQPRPDLDQMHSDANAVVWLSHGVPAKTDPVNGWYKLQTKYGKLGGNVSDKGNWFKKPFTRLIPGSVFRTSDVKPCYGRMLQGLSPHNPEVVQYALALAIPIKLPNYL
jgi:CRISPR-associated protein Csm4